MENQPNPTWHIAANITSLTEFSKANPEKGREIWNRYYDHAKRHGESDDTLARIELAREVACNPAFRSALVDHLAEVN